MAPPSSFVARLSVLFLTAVPPGWSQDLGADSLKQLSLEQLSQIEITSVTKEPVQAFQTPAAINVMNAADIRRSGARTLPDLLRLIPGLNVAQITGNEWAVGARGFQGKLSRSLLVLIDGRSVYTPLFAGVYWEMQDVMIEDIDRIEVIRGPGGTIWGSNSVNGVINIITKSTRDTRGTLVSAGTGNVEQGFLHWRYGGGTDVLSYRIYGMGFSRGPQFHSDAENYDDWRRGQAGFRADWQLDGRNAVTIQGDLYGAEAGQSLRVSSFSPPANPALQGNKLFNGQNILASWRRVSAAGSDFLVRTYYDRTDREELSYREVRHTFDVDFIHHIPKQRHDISWGAGVRISPSLYFQTAETVDFIPHQQTYNIFSAFLQDDIALVPDRLYLTIGSKVEFTTFSAFNYQPAARLSWAPDRQHTVWAAVTRAVRTASRIEDGFRFSFLAQQEPALYLRLIGDGEFTQEEMLGYEFGYRTYITSRGFIGVSLFHNRYDDLLSVENRPPEVETTPEPPHLVLPLFFRNGITAASSGGEIASLWDLRNWWRIRASYSLVVVDAKRSARSNDASTVGQLEGDTPQHQVRLQSFFGLPMRFELDVVYRYVSSIPNQSVPAYHTGDVRLGRRLTDSLEFAVVGRNLLQPHHVEYGGPPGPLVGIRRSAHITLTWTHQRQAPHRRPGGAL